MHYIDSRSFSDRHLPVRSEQESGRIADRRSNESKAAQTTKATVTPAPTTTTALIEVPLVVIKTEPTDIQTEPAIAEAAVVVKKEREELEEGECSSSDND
jgi:hypothetical protein